MHFSKYTCMPRCIITFKEKNVVFLCGLTNYPLIPKVFWQGINFYIWTEQKCIWKHWPVLHCTLSHWSCEGWCTSRVAYLWTPNSTKDKCSLRVFENDEYLESSEFLPFHHFDNKSFTLCSENFPESKVCAISY